MPVDAKGQGFDTALVKASGYRGLGDGAAVAEVACIRSDQDAPQSARRPVVLEGEADVSDGCCAPRVGRGPDQPSPCAAFCQVGL